MRIYTKNTYYNLINNDFIYQNYHKHSIYTNVIMLDSVAYPEDYAKRAKELGHGIISSCEHGYQGRYIESYQMAEKYDLKYLFAVEAYMVKDRFEKDKTNAHIILAAKNENGRKAINRILSEANETGFYYRARIDLPLLFTLPKDDVWITSACIGGVNKYPDHEEIIKHMHDYFGDNFYLEVQSHNVQSQKDWNTEIIYLSNKYQIEIMAGIDSHYINPEDAWMRDYLQKSGHIFFEEEEGFYMDYPDGQTLYKRFQEQGILTDEEIKVAISNTNVFLNVEVYTSPIFNHEVKMPSAPKYSHLSKVEKDKTLAKIVYESWEKERQNIPKEKWKEYEREIIKELKTIFEINHSDYFLLNYEIIKNAVENKGGMITYSGRGCLTGDAICSVLRDNKFKKVYLKDVKINDQIQGKDGNWHFVLNTMRYNIEENAISILARNTFTTMTSDHKVLTLIDNQEKWVKAEDLTENNVVLIYIDGLRHEFPIEKIEKTFIQGFVYDLTVQDTHSYVANGFIVHNSGPSFYVNHLLGFTAIDRISCPITLYPERFLSASRIKAGSLADIDFNCGNVPVFAESQREILGADHAYPMITFGLLKAKSAWKMYCRANDVDFEIANQISSKLDEFEKDLKYYDPEGGDPEPQVLDYIPTSLQDTFLKSKKFLGLVDHAGVHACGWLLSSFNIKEEVGIMRLKSKGGKETMVTVADGKWVEKYLMLKNDLLSVTCVKLVYLLYARCGIKPMSLTELMQACKEHPEVWKIYENGYTLGVNQLEKNSSKHKAMKYKPHNISELSALIAGIRPAFKSLIDKLINREDFSYHLPTFDKLLQTEELPQSFILYQEQIMKVLAFAGIPMDDCYTVIKSISKKRVAVIESYKPIFLDGFSKAIQEQEHKSKDEADQLANQIWGIIQDASAYGFNSSHSLSVSFDSLLAAYFKALYPLEFYEVYLNLQMDRADKAKALLAKEEARKAFGIKVMPMKFGQDNRQFTAYPEKNALSNCLKSIKGFGTIIGEETYRLAQHGPYASFLDLLIQKDELEIKINGTQMETLIRLNYFDEFGLNSKLLYTYNLYNELYSRKVLKKDQVEKLGINLEVLKKYIGKETDKQYRDIDFQGYIFEMVEKEPNKCIPICQQLNWEVSIMEIPVFKNEEVPSSWEYVLGFKTYDEKGIRPYLLLYNLQTGNMTKCSINKGKTFQDNPFKLHSIIDVKEMHEVERKTEIAPKKWVGTGEMKTVLGSYDVVIYEDVDPTISNKGEDNNE